MTHLCSHRPGSMPEVAAVRFALVEEQRCHIVSATVPRSSQKFLQGAARNALHDTLSAARVSLRMLWPAGTL